MFKTSSIDPQHDVIYIILDAKGKPWLTPAFSRDEAKQAIQDYLKLGDAAKYGPFTIAAYVHVPSL